MTGGDRRLHKVPISLTPEALPPSITPAQGLAIASLLGAGGGVSGAARAAGVTRKTVHKWLSEDHEFIALVNSLRAEMHETVRQGLLLLAPKALRTISGLISRRDTPPAIRLKASIAILEFVTAATPEGPTDPQDALNSINHLARSRQREKLTASFGTMASPDHDDLDEGDEDLDEGEDETGVPEGPVSVMELIRAEIARRDRDRAARVGDEGGSENRGGESDAIR